MTKHTRFLHLLPLLVWACGSSGATIPPAFDALDVRAEYDGVSDSVVFELTTRGEAGSLAPAPTGAVDGAPVWGYVFSTTLSPSLVGFGDIEGTLALALTSHPDFDDTPLWNEDGAGTYDDDGLVYHAHWVVLVDDARAPAGLAVRQAPEGTQLPPSAPMPMFLDSPGFTVVKDGTRIRVIVPMDRLRRAEAFSVTGLCAKMRVQVLDGAPLLGVEEVMSMAHNGESRPAELRGAPSQTWPVAESVDNMDGTESALTVSAASVVYHERLDAFLFTMDVTGEAASLTPAEVGSVDGAPVLGYVFPTNIDPAAVGFGREGILALALTSHPDFDDTPYWDESMDGDYANDGEVFHVHWAVLSEDPLSPAGLSVARQADSALLPPTAPMPMDLDSPGFHAFARDGRVTVVVPAWHLRGVETFRFDALTAAMRVDASGEGPVLRVESAFHVLSGDLSLPFDTEVAP